MMMLYFQGGEYYISCPTCRVNHLIPQGGAVNFPNAFQINSFLDLRMKLTTSKMTQPAKISSTACPKHNDPLKVYCETCCQVICRDCTISNEHNTHTFHLISECYPKHHQQLQDNLDLVKHKITDIDTAVTQLDARERQLLQQGQELKEQIGTHAQQIIDRVQTSCTALSQQVENIVQQKTQTLTAQRQQAQKLRTQLETCQEMIEHNLKEWNQLQILTDKCKMVDEMKTATQNVDPAVFQPGEYGNIKFVKTDHFIDKEIGLITTPSSPKRPSAAIHTLKSHDVSPLSSSSTLSSQSKDNVTSTSHHQLTGPVGGAASPLTLPGIRSPETRGKPVRIITGLSRPTGIVVSNENIVVPENGKVCVTVIAKSGMQRKKLLCTSESEMIVGKDVAFTADNHILVIDYHRLQKLTMDGVCVKSVGSEEEEGSGELQFWFPHGVTVHPTTGQIFVADSMNKRIQVFSNDLVFLHSITSSLFNYPYDVAFDDEGYMYVSDQMKDCIIKFTVEGKYITKFGSYGSAPSKLSSPYSLAVDHNLVYVCEHVNNRVSVFDVTGKFFYCFGKEGSGEGEFNSPVSIAIDTSGNLYISDHSNNRIVVY